MNKKPDEWPLRPRWRQVVTDHARKIGVDLKAMAPLLGITPGSLQKYLYGRTKRPGQKVLIRTAEVCGVSLGEMFLETPSANIPAGLEAVDQYRFDEITRALGSDELTAEDRQILFEDFKTSLNRLKILKLSIGKK